MVPTNFKTKLKTSYLTDIQNEWKKFLETDSYRSELIEADIFSSWQRSKSAGVDPLQFCPSTTLTVEDIQTQSISHASLKKSFGSIINIIQEITSRNNLKVQLFDKEGKSVQILLNKNSKGECYTLGSHIVRDVSENIVGTNAVSLCLHTKKPVQVVGPEHYHQFWHNIIGSASPIHDNNGEVSGVITVVSVLEKDAIDTMALTTCLSSIFDNRTLISTVLNEMNVYDFALRHILEYIPQGIAYLAESGEVKSFNRNLANIFSTNDPVAINTTINREIEPSVAAISRKDITKREIILETKGTQKSILASVKNIIDDNNNFCGQLVLVEDTEAALKSLEKYRGNKAIYTFDNIVGENTLLLKAKEVALQVASSPVPVLVIGESGTGKELFAQALHNSSGRVNEPFVAINCGAIPPELIESELFGYVAGAFTSAHKSGKIGKLELANGGTLFLDEIESMPLTVQIKLLRALSTKAICRVGGIDEIPINIRIVSACKCDLLEEADKGNFREDLYYRISTIAIELPSLRERMGDIPLLVDHFLQVCGADLGAGKLRFDDSFLHALSVYGWRGNIRELRNIIERAIVLRKGNEDLSLEHLPERIARLYLGKTIEGNLNDELDNEASEAEDLDILKIAEEIAIEKIFIEEKGNMTRTAKSLKISKPTLYAKMNNSKRLSSLKDSM